MELIDVNEFKGDSVACGVGLNPGDIEAELEPELLDDILKSEL